jgi:hypothetical protein
VLARSRASNWCREVSRLTRKRSRLLVAHNQPIRLERPSFPNHNQSVRQSALPRRRRPPRALNEPLAGIGTAVDAMGGSFTMRYNDVVITAPRTGAAAH